MAEGAPGPEPKAEEPKREIRERVEFAYRSLPSEQHPTYNEDAYVEDEEIGVFGVFDGVGGHFGGKEASAAAASSVVNEIRTAWDDITDEDADDIRPSLASVLRAANKTVISRGQELYTGEYLKLPEDSRKEWRAPQTTATIAKLYEFSDGRMKAYIANVGDSRAYLRRADGSLELITKDDDIMSDDNWLTSVETHFSVRLTDPDIARYRRLLDEVDGEMAMPDEIGRYLFRSRNYITKSLGHDDGLPLTVQTYAVDVLPGDILLLMSDGVHDNLTQPRIRDIAAATSDADELVERLSGEAYEYGHNTPESLDDEAPLVRNKRDDITVLAIQVKK